MQRERLCPTPDRAYHLWGFPMRHVFLLWSIGVAVVTLSPTIAPIPKGANAKPTKLTKELLVGRWAGYEWSGSLDGWIEFGEDGTYTAQHQPGSDTVYTGTYTVSDESIVITEWSYTPANGFGSGPQCYRFDVGFADWPTLSGKSTGAFSADVVRIPEANIHLRLKDKGVKK